MVVGMGDDPSIGEYERLLLTTKTTARKELVLLHPDRSVVPGSTREWLKVELRCFSCKIKQPYLLRLESTVGSGTLACRASGYCRFTSCTYSSGPRGCRGIQEPKAQSSNRNSEVPGCLIRSSHHHAPQSSQRFCKASKEALRQIYRRGFGGRRSSWNRSSGAE